MKKTIPILIGCILFLALMGCATRSTVVLLPDSDGNVGELVVATEGGQQVLNEANQSVQTTGRKGPPGDVKKLSDEEIRSIFSKALAAQPTLPVKFILYFLPDSNELTRESRTVIPQILLTIQKRGSTDIVIVGHTDTVGAKEYNYKLSLDRAKKMRNIMVANGAVSADITITSHGEGNPLVKTADNVAEPRNRRVEVVVK
jgi:outer membrane protein OmpA-like peptidoglycan-associated protein